MKKNEQGKWYIGSRYNPQLGTYYRREGYLTSSEIKGKENCAYGRYNLIPYDTEEEYSSAIEKIVSEGGKFVN